MAAMRPARIPTSAEYQGAPVPSITWPCSMITSKDGGPRSAAAGAVAAKAAAAEATGAKAAAAMTATAVATADRGIERHEPPRRCAAARRIALAMSPPSKGAIINSNASRDGDSTPWASRLASAIALHFAGGPREGQSADPCTGQRITVYLMTYSQLLSKRRV